MCLASRVRSCDGATLIRRRLGILPTNLGGSPARRLGRAAIAFACDSSADWPRSMDANLFFTRSNGSSPSQAEEFSVHPGFKVGGVGSTFKKKGRWIRGRKGREVAPGLDFITTPPL